MLKSRRVFCDEALSENKFRDGGLMSTKRIWEGGLDLTRVELDSVRCFELRIPR